MPNEFGNSGLDLNWFLYCQTLQNPVPICIPAINIRAFHTLHIKVNTYDCQYLLDTYNLKCIPMGMYWYLIKVLNLHFPHN